MREKIRLDSSAGTGHFYTTTKNKRTMTEKFEIKKFDPTIRKHVIYKENKINKFYFLSIFTLCGYGISILLFLNSSKIPL